MEIFYLFPTHSHYSGCSNVDDLTRNYGQMVILLSISKLPLITIFHISNMKNHNKISASNPYNQFSKCYKCQSCGHTSRQHPKSISQSDKYKTLKTTKYSKKDYNNKCRIVSPNDVRVISVAPHQFVDDYMVVEVMKNKKKPVKRNGNGLKQIKQRESPIRYHRFETETIMAYSDVKNQYQLPNYMEKCESRTKLASTKNEPIETINQQESLVYQNFRQETQKTQSHTVQSQESPSKRQIGKFTKPRPKPKNIFEQGLSSIHLEDQVNTKNLSFNSKQCIQLSYSCSNMDNECSISKKQLLMSVLTMKPDEKSVSDDQQLLLSNPSSMKGETEAKRANRKYLVYSEKHGHSNKENYMGNSSYYYP